MGIFLKIIFKLPRIKVNSSFLFVEHFLNIYGIIENKMKVKYTKNRMILEKNFEWVKSDVKKSKKIIINVSQKLPILQDSDFTVIL